MFCIWLSACPYTASRDFITVADRLINSTYCTFSHQSIILFHALPGLGMLYTRQIPWLSHPNSPWLSSALVTLLISSYIFFMGDDHSRRLLHPTTMVVQDGSTSSSSSNNNNTSTSINSSSIAELTEATCPSLQYANVRCPVWDSNHHDGGPGVDYRVRWIHHHQNPLNCSQANYFIRPMIDWIGFGANVMMSVESGMYISLYSDRILLLDPDSRFRYASCEKQTWDCYFEPLSNCTVGDAEAIVASRGGEYDTRLTNPDDRVLRPSRVSR